MSDQGKYSHPNASGDARSSSEHETLDTERLKSQGKEAAQDISDAAQHQAEHFYDQQRELITQQAGKFTRVMNKTADEFDSQHQPFLSQQARKAASFADGFSDQFKNKDLGRVCHDVQDYGRREPAMFIGGAIAAGFLVARFLRSSQHGSQGRGSQGQSSGGYDSQRYGSRGEGSTHYSERHTDMNAAGSHYASQHASPRSHSSFDDDRQRFGSDPLADSSGSNGTTR